MVYLRNNKFAWSVIGENEIQLYDSQNDNYYVIDGPFCGLWIKMEYKLSIHDMVDIIKDNYDIESYEELKGEIEIFLSDLVEIGGVDVIKEKISLEE